MCIAIKGYDSLKQQQQHHLAMRSLSKCVAAAVVFGGEKDVVKQTLQMVELKKLGATDFLAFSTSFCMFKFSAAFFPGFRVLFVVYHHCLGVALLTHFHSLLLTTFIATYYGTLAGEGGKGNDSLILPRTSLP